MRNTNNGHPTLIASGASMSKHAADRSKQLQCQVGRSIIGASCGSMWEFETAMAASSVLGAKGQNLIATTCARVESSLLDRQLVVDARIYQ